MKRIDRPIPLSLRTVNCLNKAGMRLNKKAIIKALEAGKLYPYQWPPNYGKVAHEEVCRWAGIDGASLPLTKIKSREIYPQIGLSYRAWRTLQRANIPATKRAVRHAIKTGHLAPGKRPANYGRVTHNELSRWVKRSDA